MGESEKTEKEKRIELDKAFYDRLCAVLDQRNFEKGRFGDLLTIEVRSVSRGVPGKESVEGCQPWIEYDFHGEKVHENPYGGIHGGVIASLFDTCGGMGAMTMIDGMASTTALEVSYLRALRNKEYRIFVEFTHVGKRMVSASARITDKLTKEVCATGHITYMMIQGGGSGLKD